MIRALYAPGLWMLRFPLCRKSMTAFFVLSQEAQFFLERLEMSTCGSRISCKGRWCDIIQDRELIPDRARAALFCAYPRRSVLWPLEDFLLQKMLAVWGKPRTMWRGVPQLFVGAHGKLEVGIAVLLAVC